MVWFAVAAVASSALSAFGSHQSGKAANKAAKYNAATYEQNARFTESEKPIVSENARNERRRLAETYHTVVSDFVVAKAASGIDPNFGSAKAIQQDALRAYTLDRDILARNEVYALQDKDREAYNYRRQAAVTRAEGKNAQIAGNLAAFTTLLGSASSLSGMFPSGGGGVAKPKPLAPSWVGPR